MLKRIIVPLIAIILGILVILNVAYPLLLVM